VHITSFSLGGGALFLDMVYVIYTMLISPLMMTMMVTNCVICCEKSLYRTISTGWNTICSRGWRCCRNGRILLHIV